MGRGRDYGSQPSRYAYRNICSILKLKGKYSSKYDSTKIEKINTSIKMFHHHVIKSLNLYLGASINILLKKKCMYQHCLLKMKFTANKAELLPHS